MVELTAGRVRGQRPAPGDRGERIWLEGFITGTEWSFRVAEHPALARAVHADDEALVMALQDTGEQQPTPFYCFACERSYCKSHWRLWPVLRGELDGYRADCPYGHRATFTIFP